MPTIHSSGNREKSLNSEQSCARFVGNGTHTSHPMTTTEIPYTDPTSRTFPPFSLTRLLATVFEPTEGCRVCILIDFEDPADVKASVRVPRQTTARDPEESATSNSTTACKDGAMEELGMTGGEMFAFPMTYGSQPRPAGRGLRHRRATSSSLDATSIRTTTSSSASPPSPPPRRSPRSARQFGFRGATMHGLNDVILSSGLAVDYDEVSADAEKLRLAMTKADEIEIDFALEDGRVLTAWLGLDGQEAQKSHGLCKGETPDIANLPAGEVYFVPVDASGQFPMKYEDGTLGVLDVERPQHHPRRLSSRATRPPSTPTTPVSRTTR